MSDKLPLPWEGLGEGAKLDADRPSPRPLPKGEGEKLCRGLSENLKCDMKSLTEVVASLLLALVLLRASGSLVGIIYEWKLRAGKF